MEGGLDRYGKCLGGWKKKKGANDKKRKEAQEKGRGVIKSQKKQEKILLSKWDLMTSMNQKTIATKKQSTLINQCS